MRFSILLIFLTLIHWGGQSNAQMRQVYVDNLQTDNDIKKISMYSASSGYIAFTQWVGFTTDSGRTFTKKYITAGNVDYNGYSVNLIFGFGISGVQAFNADTIIVYGDYGFVPAILYSTDGGNTFRLVYQSTRNTQRVTLGVTDMLFPGNTAVGYAVEADRIIKTVDRGKTWIAVRNDPNSFFNHLEAIDPSNIFAYSDGKLLRTNTAGSSWQQLIFPGTTINCVSFISSSRGWINIQDDRGIYYTNDSGNTWTRRNNPTITPFSCNKMRFLDDSSGFAIGPLYTTYKTADSGKTWEPLPRDNQYTFQFNSHTDLYFWSHNQFWAGGGQGFLELTTNGGGTPLPRAFFTIDTTALSSTGMVHLINYSRRGYQYRWYLNDTLISTSYNVDYHHDIYRAGDTIQLIVSNNANFDASIQYQYFVPAPPPPVPAISSFTPQSGGTGTIVTIKGSHFSAITSVTFGGTPAASFSALSDTILYATIGSGTSGFITVSGPFGSASLSGFIFTARLIVTSVSPSYGPAGATVVISGSNFSTSPGENIVYFGSVRANVLTSTRGQLTVVVPTGAAYEPLSVTVNSVTVYTRLPYPIVYIGGDTISPAIWPGKTDFPTDVNAFQIVTGDFDGDGRPDIVTSNYNAANRLTVLKNNSTIDSAIFVKQPYLNITPGNNGDALLALGITDADGDGKLDIIAANNALPYGITVFRNTSTNSAIGFGQKFNFGEGIITTPSHIAIADLNLDGKPDIVATTESGALIYQNTDTANTISFTILPVSTLRGNIVGKCGVADIDGDGKADIILSTVSGIHVYLNTSNAGIIKFADPAFFAIATEVSFIPSMAIGDLDGDGQPDIVVRTSGNGFGILRNAATKGSIAFDPPANYATPSNIGILAIDDLNGDGKPDIAASGYWSTSNLGNDIQTVIWGNRSVPGSLSFYSETNLGYDKQNHHGINISLADFNGDGKSDIATLNAATVDVSILLNRTTTTIPVCAGAGTSLTSNLSGTTYRWQQKTDSIFADISDGPNFSGTTTATLNINNISASLNGTQYRCKIGNSYSKLFSILVRPSMVPSVTILSTDTSICPGALATFTAIPVNGGASPSFQWKVNGVNAGVDTGRFSSSTLKDGDQVSVILTSNAACLSTAQASSNIIQLKINQVTIPSIGILTPDTAICAGSPATFTAIISGGGSTPAYQWRVNGVNTGSNSSTYTTNVLQNGDMVDVAIESSAACSSPRSVASKAITITVYPSVPPEISFTASSTSICADSQVEFIATSVNGGSKPIYQWTKNGVNVGQDSSLYIDNNLKNGDIIAVMLTSNAMCSSPKSVASRPIAITVYPNVSPEIAFTASSASICAGSQVEFVATSVNGGSKPIYQWTKNGVNVGQDSSLYIDNSLKNGDIIAVLLTSSAMCSSPKTKKSSDLVCMVKDPTSLSVTIAGTTNVDSGMTSVIIANSIGSMTPVYQWQDSTKKHNWQSIEGASQSTLSYVPGNSNDKIRCIINTDAPCVSQNSDTSNVLIFFVNKPITSPPVVDSSTNVQFFPNPTSETLNIGNLSSSDPWQSLKIVDINGKQWIMVPAITNQNSISIDVSGLGKGTYIAILRRRSGSVAYFKFLKL